MDERLQRRLAEAANGAILPKAEWHEIIEALLDDFSEFIGVEFFRDDEVLLQPETSSFARWIWSPETPADGLSVVWSAVLAGCLFDEAVFGASISLFLFHGATRKRLISTSTRETYLSYMLSCTSETFTGWRSAGWTEDEYHEWDDVALPEAN